MASLVWFRLDLRLTDNPALNAAVKRGEPVIPVFVHAPDEESPWEPGGASRWWLHQSLASLDSRLREVGSCLVIRRGPSLEALRRLLHEAGARAIFLNRRYEPAIRARDNLIENSLRAEGVEVESFNSALLYEPWTIKNKSGRTFQVFTPFWKHCLSQPEPAKPQHSPKKFPTPSKWPGSLALNALDLEPKIDWAAGFRTAWQPGEAGAQQSLRDFLASALARYPERRELPGVDGTSRLSPHLHFGEIGPRQVWHAVAAKLERAPSGRAGRLRDSRFLTELGWREFAHHLLYHFPHTPTEPLRPAFKHFRWRNNPTWLKAWQKGLTGYPIVDAGMRQLWTTGWMHNRVRMIVASFLAKDLLISWQEGARWFWDTLVDADLAQNTLGWQWTAGCGADAAPYFRIFNPVAQGEKFDPHSDYVRRWCPELVHLLAKWIHQPWTASSSVLDQAEVSLGNNYPKPIVQHFIAREIALEAFARIRAST